MRIKSYPCYVSLCLLLVFPLAVFATPPFKAGKDYQVLKNVPTIARQHAKGKVKIIEFFSYGCPWCFRLEPKLEAWLRTKPKDVNFSRVPVVFESGWAVYAKAYYSAKALGVLSKMTPAIFAAIHEKGMQLTSEQAMREFFVSHGVSSQKFNAAYNFSPTISAELSQGDNLLKAYKIIYVPALVVDGKYKIDASMVNGNYPKMLKILDYLVHKTQTETKNS